MHRVPRRFPARFIQTLTSAPRQLATSTALSLAAISFALSGLVVSPAPISAQDASTAGTPAAALCPVDGNNVPVAAAEAGQVFTIGEGSTASYTVDEVLTGQGDNTAVGTTNAFIGTILLDKDGTPLPCSTFYVDLRTLTTDSDRRDGQVQKVLETTEYPLGTFILTSVDGLDSALTDGQEQAIKLIGDLTVHNVTKTVTWDAKVTLDGEKLTGSATTNVTFADFDMEAPVLGPVASIEDTFQLSVDITAAKAS